MMDTDTKELGHVRATRLLLGDWNRNVVAHFCLGNKAIAGGYDNSPRLLKLACPLRPITR